jgi:hypothetical protein
LVPGSWFLVPGSKFQVLGFRFQVPGTKNYELRTIIDVDEQFVRRR